MLETTTIINRKSHPHRFLAVLVLTLSLLLAGCVEDNGDANAGTGSNETGSDSGNNDNGSDSDADNGSDDHDDDTYADNGDGDKDSGSDSSGEVTLSWHAPQTREDGTAFLESEVSHYEVAYGKESGEYTEVIEDLRNDSTRINSLTSGEEYYFTVRVFDQNGLVSEFSEEQSTIVD